MFKLFRFLKPFALPAVVTVILVMAGAVTELYLPTLMADIVDKGIVNGDIPYILRDRRPHAPGGAGRHDLRRRRIAALIRVSMGFGRDLRGEGVHPRGGILPARVRQASAPRP